MVFQLRGRGYKDRAINIADEIWDRRLGIRTFGFHPGSGTPGQANWHLHYTPTTYSRIFKTFDIAGLNRDDVFVDLGAGMGRSVFAASYRGVVRATGVDIVETLCEKARRNLQSGRYRNVDFKCIDASAYTFDNTTVLFMAHSFGDDILRKVVANLEPRKAGLRIIYINPIYDFVLDEVPWLEQFDSMPEEKTMLPLSARYAVKFWRTKKSHRNVAGSAPGRPQGRTHESRRPVEASAKALEPG